MSGKPGVPRARKGASIDFRLRLHMVEAPSGCWIWAGARNSSGHGRIYVDGKTRYAHRVAYETWVGPIPDGLQLDHLCRRPACIKPMHLQPVTPQVNVLRGTAPGARTTRGGCCSKGHPHAEFGREWRGRTYCRQCYREWKAVAKAEGRGCFALKEDAA